MCDTALAFGEGDTYLLECPSRRCFNDLPPGIVESLRDGDIATTLNVAFGPGGSFVIAYKQPCSRGILMEAFRVAPGLNKWLFEKNSSGQAIRSFAKLQVSIGPTQGRFWATDGSSWVWEGLPKQLQQKVSSMLNNGLWTTATPKLVSLGFGDDFVMIMESGNTINVFWDLPNYPDLEQSIKVVAEKGRLGDLGFEPVQKRCLLPGVRRHSYSRRHCGQIPTGGPEAGGRYQGPRGNHQSQRSSWQCHGLFKFGTGGGPESLGHGVQQSLQLGAIHMQALCA
ncbi:hypothetical protein B0H67DRAFT_582399 [Lasiosphaeris hirsuta]|uniref:Uncharacterized protein n=1 Tax=Lasiosphaeris hirsuta TaxID=260670 RepID=A0AA40AHV1_9PEZI|nr:hypothetical protein B0H67DRAFT_582399 [Lasiosphaeris hirsuta]